MGIITLDGFDFIQDLNGDPDAFIVKGESLIDEIEYIKLKNIKSIYLTYFKSKNIKNLDFLNQVPFVEKVNLNGLEVDYLGLYHLKSLKSITLSVINKNQHLDFSYFSELETLSIDWYKDFPSLSKNSNLKELFIWKFKPKSKSLRDLSLPTKIEKIHISDSNIYNLEGLELSELKEFEAHYCNALESVNGITGFSNNLIKVVFDNCKKLKYYEGLRFALNIEVLIMTNCGDIPSLFWLNDLKKLKLLNFFNTKLVDGDTSFCLPIDEVIFKNQNYYNFKQVDFDRNN